MITMYLWFHLAYITVAVLTLIPMIQLIHEADNYDNDKEKMISMLVVLVGSILWPISLFAVITGLVAAKVLERLRNKTNRICGKWFNGYWVSQYQKNDPNPSDIRAFAVENIHKLTNKELQLLLNMDYLAISALPYARYKDDLIKQVIYDEMLVRALIQD